MEETLETGYRTQDTGDRSSKMRLSEPVSFADGECLAVNRARGKQDGAAVGIKGR